MNHCSHFKTAFIVALLLVAFSVGAEAPAFKVSMRIVENGEELSTPLMLVKEGADASISVGGDNPVSVGLRVNQHHGEQAHVRAQVETKTNSMSPELLVTKGEWASLSVGELEFHVLVQAYAANK